MIFVEEVDRMNNLKRDSLRWMTLTSLFGFCLMSGGLAVAERGTADTAMEPGAGTMQSKSGTSGHDISYLPEQHEALFSQLDVNRDGDIDREEAQAYPPVAEEFDRLADEETGRITPSEFAAFEINQP
jgi:hypothetical protein